MLAIRHVCFVRERGREREGEGQRERERGREGGRANEREEVFTVQK